MGETFCQTGGVHMAMDIVRNQINIDRELPISSKSIYRTRMSISSFGSANQITSDAHEGKENSFSTQWCWPPARDDVVVPAQAGQ